MRLCYNAGFDDVDGFEAWWASEGEERYEEYLSEAAQRDSDKLDERLSDEDGG